MEEYPLNNGKFGIRTLATKEHETSQKVQMLFTFEVKKLLLLCLLAPLYVACEARPFASSAPPVSSAQPSSHAPSLSPLAPSSPMPAPRGDSAAPAYGQAVRLATLESKEITESSGIVASRNMPGMFWTHNDSGNSPTLYLIDRKGRTRGTWIVAGIRMRDWEDIAAGTGTIANRSYLYLGDIGDNTARRREISVYRIPEPTLSSSNDAPSPITTQRTEAAEHFRLRYPEGARDSEALLVHPVSGDLYIVTKQALEPAEVYRATAPLDATRILMLTRIATLNIPSLFGGLITGGDIAPDGRRLALCDYTAAYEFVLPPNAASFDAIWQQPPTAIALNPRRQGEAICYRLDGRALLTTSEGTPTPLDEVEQSVKTGGVRRRKRDE